MDIPKKSYKPIHRISIWALLFGILTMEKNSFLAIPLVVSTIGLFKIKNWGRVLFIICSFLIIGVSLLGFLSIDSLWNEARRIAEKPGWNPAYIVAFWVSFRIALISFFSYSIYYLLKKETAHLFTSIPHLNSDFGNAVSTGNPPMSDFLAVLDQSYLKGLQRVYVIFIAMLVLFGGVITLAAFKAPAKEVYDGARMVATTTTIINIILCGVCYWLSHFLFMKQFEKKALEKLPQRALWNEKGELVTNPVEKYLCVIRSAMVYRIGLRGVAAMVGIAFCLSIAFMGALKENPIYWINVFPVFLFFIFLPPIFPTREKISQIYASRIASQR